jgi:hypothetical protein
MVLASFYRLIERKVQKRKRFVQGHLVTELELETVQFVHARFQERSLTTHVMYELSCDLTSAGMETKHSRAAVR